MASRMASTRATGTAATVSHGPAPSTSTGAYSTMSDDKVFQEIEELDSQRSQALIDGDIDKVETFLGSSLHYVHSSSTDEDRTDYLKKLRNGFYKYLALESSEKDYRRFGDCVIINGLIRVHVIANGNDKDFKARYTQIWVVEDSAWKMVSWQTTLLPVT